MNWFWKKNKRVKPESMVLPSMKLIESALQHTAIMLLNKQIEDRLREDRIMNEVEMDKKRLDEIISRFPEARNLQKDRSCCDGLIWKAFIDIENKISEAIEYGRRYVRHDSAEIYAIETVLKAKGYSVEFLTERNSENIITQTYYMIRW